MATSEFYPASDRTIGNNYGVFGFYDEKLYLTRHIKWHEELAGFIVNIAHLERKNLSGIDLPDRGYWYLKERSRDGLVYLSFHFYGFDAIEQLAAKERWGWKSPEIISADKLYAIDLVPRILKRIKRFHFKYEKIVISTSTDRYNPVILDKE